MKKMSLYGLALALVLCMTFSTVAHAAEVETYKGEEVVANLGDVIITYSPCDEHDAEVRPASETNPVEDNYNGVWLDNGTHYGKELVVHNTHKGRIGMTISVESNSNGSYAQINITNPKGLPLLRVLTVRPNTPKSQREFIIENGLKGDYTLHYTARSEGGMRLNCWTYKWYD